MTNQEGIERLQRIDFERSNVRDRLAIHHAITILERVEKLPELIGSSPDPFQSDIVEYLQTGKWEW